jgi:putative peptidoglycan lipid II flippase
VIIPVFFALGDSLRPMLVALLTIGLKLGCVLALLPLMSYQGLVLATSIAVSVEAAVMWWLMRRRIGSMLPGTASGLVRIVVATALMVALAWGALELLPASWDEPSKPLQLIKLALGGAVGGVVYVGACVVLRVRELGELARKVKGKLKPPGPPGGAPPRHHD